jgi:transcription elongation factor Elf1
VSFLCALLICTFQTVLPSLLPLVTGQGPRIQKCPICQKVCLGPADLRHIQSHFGRHYTCSMCDKSFSRPSHLQEHVLTHTGEKPYSCDICGKRFNKKGNMKTHQIVHSQFKAWYLWWRSVNKIIGWCLCLWLFNFWRNGSWSLYCFLKQWVILLAFSPPAYRLE